MKLPTRSAWLANLAAEEFSIIIGRRSNRLDALPEYVCPARGYREPKVQLSQLVADGWIVGNRSGRLVP